MLAVLAASALAAPVVPLHGNLLDKRQVVLSFDDGPNNATSPILLDVLARHGLHALFFHVGVNIDNPSLMRRFMRAGHCVGVHTMHHAHLTKLSARDAEQEIDDCVDAFRNVTGERPFFFRPPYGETSSALTRIVAERGMASFMWDFDSSDWMVHHALAKRIGAQLHRHGILLMHEYQWTTDELEQIVQTIAAHGFEIVHPIELFDRAQLLELRREACPSNVQAWCDYRPMREKLEL